MSIPPRRFWRKSPASGVPGALYLLTCPDPRSEALQQPIAQPSYFQKPNHVHIIQHDEFARYVQDAGLEILSRHSFGFFWSIWLALFWSSGSNADELGEKFLPASRPSGVR